MRSCTGCEQDFLSSAYWPKTITVYDKHKVGADGVKGDMVEQPNLSYKAPFQRTEKVLQAALMHQGKAWMAECQ